MITVDDYLNHWRITHPQALVPDGELTLAIRAAADITVYRANRLLQAFGQERQINSGWRPREVNVLIKGAAPFSRHMTGEAIDLEDGDGALDDWCDANGTTMVVLDLYREHPSATYRWCHVQTHAPGSGNRVFYP